MRRVCLGGGNYTTTKTDRRRANQTDDRPTQHRANSSTNTHQLNRYDLHVVPKTKRAGRIIRVDQTTITRLETWRTVQDRHRAYAEPVWQQRNIVTTTASGTLIQRNNFARSMRQLCQRLNIDPHVTPYELRHTAISLQAENGQTPWNIADWAGTSEK